MSSIAEQPPVQRKIERGGYQKDISDPGKHERRQRVVDHWFVIHGQQLLADRERGGMQSRSGAASENDAFRNHGKNAITQIPVLLRYSQRHRHHVHTRRAYWCLLFVNRAIRLGKALRGN